MRLTAAAIVGVLAMAGCGDDERPAVDVTRPTSPVHCPSRDGGAAPAAGAAAFDARGLLGLSLADAEREANDHDCTVRVTVEDGREQPQTLDLRTDRINVETRDGAVVALRGIG